MKYQCLSNILLAAVVMFIASAETWAQKGNKPGGSEGSTGPNFTIYELSGQNSSEGLAFDINENNEIVGHLKSSSGELDPAYWTFSGSGRTFGSKLTPLQGGDCAEQLLGAILTSSGHCYRKDRCSDDIRLRQNLRLVLAKSGTKNSPHLHMGDYL